MTAMLAALRAIGRWLLAHPVAALAVAGGLAVAWYRRRARRAGAERDAAVVARVRAEDAAVVTTEAMERHHEGDRTTREVIDAARDAAHANPSDTDAPARAARDYARRRHAGLRAADADGDSADPVRGDASAGPAAGGRGR